MSRVTYAHNFVEAVVLEAERGAPAETRRAFRQARNRVYRIADADAREMAFQALHRDWFVSFKLHRPVDAIVAGQRDLVARVGQCRVLLASRPQDEGADLFDYVAPRGSGRQPLLVIRLRPPTLFDDEALAAFLRHELMHVSDMLDPRFGYRRTLPVQDEGPSAETLVRDRYRTLWDVTIDGRLFRQGVHAPEVRARRAREFAATFRMLGDETERVFVEWFEQIEPTHDRIVEFALHPPRSGGRAHNGRCPLCRFPAVSLEAAPERVSPETRRLIEEEHPDWDVTEGLCRQCLDLFEASQLTGR